MGRVLRIASVNLALFVVLIAGMEGCVRLTHPEIGPLGTDAGLIADSMFQDVPGPRPGATGRSNGQLFVVSSEGFWRYSSLNDSAEVKWLLLGDSVTMGIGVHPDSTFAGRLARRMPAFEILNPSLIGYASDDYVKVLDSVLNRYPHVERVTVMWCLNDAYSSIPTTEDPGRAFRTTLGPILGFIHRHIYLYQWLKAGIFDRPERYFAHDLRLYSDRHIYAAIVDLQTIAETCAGSAIECEIVLIPYEYQLRAAHDNRVFFPQEVLTGELNGSALTVYDASEYFLAANDEPSDLYLYGDGIHLSELGHRFMADYLAALPN